VSPPDDTQSAAADVDAPSAAVAPVSPPLLRGRLADTAGIASGLLYFLAFAGMDVWPVTFICLVPLILAFSGQTPKRATWIGFLAGLAMNLGGFYWLLNMLKTFSGFPTAICLVFVVIICAYQGGRFALLGWLHGRATARGWPAPVVFAAAFAASELVYPLLFPWYYAATVHQVPVLMQTAELGSPILVGLLLVCVNLAVAEPIRARLAAGVAGAATASNGTSEERSAVTYDRKVIGVGVLALAFALVFGAVRISMVKADVARAPSARVGYVQGNLGLMQKREDPGEGLRRHRRLTSELKAKGVDFVVWSESSVTFAVPEELASKGFFRDRFAASLGVPTIFGAVLFRVEPERERWFNTAIATNAKGEYTGRYDKQYLLAFGEYLPFGDWFPILYKWSPHSGRFSKGTSLEPVELQIRDEKHPVSVLICYEDILPAFTNAAVRHANPELLVNITNDAWFGDTAEPWQHLALAKYRAIEHRRFLVRSTNSGVSAIVDPMGGLVSNTKTFVPDAQDGEVRWMRSRTVYEMVGDAPWWLATVGIVVASFRRRKGARAPA
jgi:apolipoprotein N-acyltransferase